MTSPTVLSPSLAPGDYTSLESFAAHVQEIVLHLRDEGHVLSSVDQHYIERWWEAGYPLEVVLSAVLDGGRRLMARKRRPRGLPLKSLHKRVEKGGSAAQERNVGASAVAKLERGSGEVLPARLRNEVERALTEDPREPVRAARRRALAGLAELADSKGAGASAFAACLAVSRRYYDDLMASLPGSEVDRLHAEASARLGDGARRMTAEALGETLEELARRSLRQQDSLLDPTYWVPDP